MLDVVMLFAALLLAFSTPVDAAPSFAPCATAPKGMACVPGGRAVVGADDGGPAEKPKRTVQISTFYIDLKEATNAEFQACVDSGACPKLNVPAGTDKALTAPELPAMPLDWDRAEKYCTWAGKRLPTEWEWEKAARGPDGDVFPWGNDAATCEKGLFRECAPKCKTGGGKDSPFECVEHAAKAPGAFPAGHFGLFDMAGNAYEWTDTWAGKTERCSVGCEGLDPRGPCDGASPCGDDTDKKILRGGSWYWPKDQARASNRRKEFANSDGHRIAVRCATSSTVLTRFPAKIGATKRPKRALPTPPTEEQKKMLTDITEDKLDTQVCEKQGRAFIDCRDPNSYIKSNEPRQELWRPYIENLGGGYTGVGIDQNLTFIASARSEWAWLFDYDPTVVRLHWVIRAMVLNAENRGAFVDYFRPDHKDAALKIVEDVYKDNPERAAYREVYMISKNALLKYYEKSLKGEGDDPTFGWLATDEAYEYIRTMYQQGRIHIMKGDMLAKNTMHGIGEAAKKMGVTIRVYYPSNAPECWPFTPNYKSNVTGLPFDDQTVVLQTLSGRKSGYGKPKGYWHYNVQSGLEQQELIKRKGIVAVKQLVWVRNMTQDPDLTISGLAAAE